jgi:restriction system protein
MLTKNSLQWNGLKDPTAFRNALNLRFQEFEGDDDESAHYAVHLQCPPLSLSEEIRDTDESQLAAKVQQVINQWMARWHDWQEKQEAQAQRDALIRKKDQWAQLLSQGLDQEHTVDLNRLRDLVPFESSALCSELKSKLDSIVNPPAPRMGFQPPRPPYNEPEISFSQKLLFKRRGIIRRYQEEYDRKLETWERIGEKIQQNYDTQMAAYQEKLQQLEAERHAIREAIEAARESYEADRARKNQEADVLEVNYHSRQPEAVEAYLQLALEQSDYPEDVPRNIEQEYHRENHTLFVTMELPHPDSIPKTKEVSPQQNNQQLRVTEYSEQEFGEVYNRIGYELILRTFHELFSADSARVLDAISLNAWVRILNRGNGQYENICIATLFTSREEYEKLNLRQVDPVLCFRFLKGVSAPLLSDLTPIPTRFKISRRSNDSLPVRHALEPMDPDKNLANTGWPEFEKMMLDLFAREFGQVEPGLTIIQSAQESGLEALGLDPDPVRGGKIVFVARRSTKPVAVSAVKEIFGSVIHEGALKGILATTADFTPEAYEFARNKPITLLNGSNLLTLFEKHGQKLRINLREAVSLESWLK